LAEDCADKVLRVPWYMKTNQITGQKAFQDLLTPWNDIKDVGRRKRRMVEKSNLDIGFKLPDPVRR